MTKEKRLGKLVILIGIRQLWFLGKNIYHLAQNPYLTLKRLREEKDKSQIALIAGVVFLPIIFYIGARIFWDKFRYGEILRSAGGIFVAVMVIQILILSYLGFWIWRAWRKR